MRSLLVLPLALAVLIALVCGAGATAQAPTTPTVQATPGPSSCGVLAPGAQCLIVEGEGRVSLLPHSGVNFVFPIVPLAPNQPAVPAASPMPDPRLQQELHVRSQSDVSAEVSYRGAELTIAVPDAFVIQVHLRVTTPSFGGCTAVTGQASTIRCRVPLPEPVVPSPAPPGSMSQRLPPGVPLPPPPPMTMSFTTVPVGTETQTATLLPHNTAILFAATQPTPADVPNPRRATVVSATAQQVTLTWDGPTLLITAPTGYGVQAVPAGRCTAGGAWNVARCSIGSGDNGPVTVTTSPPRTAPIPGEVMLTPGEAVTFGSAPPLPPPGSPPRPAGRPTFVGITNESTEPATVAMESGQLTISVPDGFAIQVRSGGGPRLSSCVAVGGRPHVVRCLLPGAPFPAQVTFTTVATTIDAHDVVLPPHGAVALIDAKPRDGGAGVDRPAFIVESASEAAVHVTWDGSTFMVTVPEGLVAVVDVVAPRVLSEGLPCGAVDGHANAVACPLDAPLPERVAVRTVTPAPTGPLTVAYGDRDGPGTLTITSRGPDAVPGGIRATVTLTQNGVTLQGEGVLRPEPKAHEFLLSFTHVGPEGTSYLFAGRLMAAGASWSGSGLLLVDAEPIHVDTWHVGNVAPDSPPINMVSIGQVAPSGAPGLPLPTLVGDRLRDLNLLSGQIEDVAPPVLGSAGQPIELRAVTSLPFGVPIAQLTDMTYTWRFGDGTGTSPIAEQQISHVYAVAGDYTVIAIVTDPTGMPRVGATRIRITSRT